ncbi:hypothetical protein CEXT_184201 [Caerostris extrusa]|uniref:Uncharacterized protein n=1 Tax=Caerostris extrusa TaxID=172846 RepID=A0AAV4RXX3_CAEEX|nr:hypothetical protein CEXT_184201 [Caerostris extrusa]
MSLHPLLFFHPPYQLKKAVETEEGGRENVFFSPPLPKSTCEGMPGLTDEKQNSQPRNARIFGQFSRQMGVGSAFSHANPYLGEVRHKSNSDCLKKNK